MSDTYIVTGESEDGWFLREMTKDEIQEFLAARTQDNYNGNNVVDFENLERREGGSVSIRTDYYATGLDRFVIIDGEIKDINAKELVTEVDLE